MDKELARAAAKMRDAAAAAGLAEVADSTSYGTPSLTVRKKLLARVKDADTLVVRCTVEEKEVLIAAAPEIYFETDHYKGWSAVLVRLSKISAPELRVRLERAWRMQAPKRLVALRDKGS